jgi:hypothetical protein
MPADLAARLAALRERVEGDERRLSGTLDAAQWLPYLRLALAEIEGAEQMLRFADGCEPGIYADGNRGDALTIVERMERALGLTPAEYWAWRHRRSVRGEE